MPAQLNVDWSLIQSLYVKGVSPKQIANEFNIKTTAVQSRAKRLKWYQYRLKAATSLALEQVNKAEKSLKQRGLAVLEMLQETVETNVKVAQKLPKPKKWSELELSERALKQLTDRAKATAGLDNPGSLTLVNIERLSLQDDTENTPPIDVTATKPA